MIKILQVAYGFEGGIGRLLVDYSKRLKDKIEVEFLITHYENGIFEKCLIDMGFKVYRIYKELPLKEKEKVITKILNDNNYDVIHIHGSCDYQLLKCAKKKGIKVRIVHSHNSIERNKKNFVYELSRKVYREIKNNMLITEFWACGKDAAISSWGLQKYEQGKVHIMKNAINIEEFKFSKEKRDKIRKELDLEDKFIVGNVGRLTTQKNHEFLINVFNSVKEIRDDALLLIIGSGDLESQLKMQVKKLGLQEKVRFLGARNDVSEILNAMDVFVLTSIYEGLPVVMIEAQANGLNCIVSDCITKECNIMKGNKYLSLEDNYFEWAEYICNARNYNRLDSIELISKAGYDVNEESKKLVKYYESLV